MHRRRALKRKQPISRAPSRQVTCKQCGEEFTSKRMQQRFVRLCSVKCAREFSEAKAKKKRVSSKPDDRPLSWHLEVTQKDFNKWIRLRDKNKPCISCGKTHAKWDAGHFRPRSTHSYMRFHEDNVHKQCAYCNMHLSGNLTEYLHGLIQRVGEERAMAMFNARNKIKNWTKRELKAIRKEYRARIAAIQKGGGDER